jgi:predicted HicB family RNase H-like nuclease
MKRVNIAIDSSVHKKAKVIAVLKGITLNEYLESAIDRALRREGQRLRIR